MKSKKCVKQRILDLLRDTEQTAVEIALELRVVTSDVQAAIPALISDGLLVCVDDGTPAIYTSNYDKLKVKVYTTDDDTYEKVTKAEEIVIQRDPIDALFFAKPEIVVYNQDGHRVVQLSDRLFKQIETRFIIYPFSESGKFLAVSTDVIKHLHFDIGVPMEDLEECDCFKIVNRDE